MKTLTRRADESILIGEHLTVTVTDVDANGVRLLLDGELIGGPDDGMTIREARELAIGGEVRIGSLVTLGLAEIKGKVAKMVVGAPKHVAVQRKELVDPRGPTSGPAAAG